MHEYMIRILTSFATSNKLRFDYYFDDITRCYNFIFTDEERVWHYRFEESEERLDSYAGSSVDYAYYIIRVLEEKMPGVYKER